MRYFCTFSPTPSPMSQPSAEPQDQGTDRVRDADGSAAKPSAPAATDGDTAPLPTTFEAALTELEAVVASMESGELALEDSLRAYQRGARLLQYCQAKLGDAQQQVKVLEAGVLKDFFGAAENGQ
jgi:exodeoxyribonuclease VII small subunit